MEYGLDIERRDNDHKYPLIYAFEEENDIAFQYLLEKELDFRSFISTLYNRLSELSLLLSSNNNIFDLLIKNGFDANRKDQYGKNLLNYVIEKMPTDEIFIPHLLEFGIDFNLRTEQNKELFLEYFNTFNTIQLLFNFSDLIANFQENIINYFNNNISIFKPIFRKVKTIKIVNVLIILIQNGLNIDSSDEEGNTLLVYAIQEKKEDTVYYLLKYHSSLELINTKIEILKPLIQIKNTILFNGINLIKNIRILKMLIQQGIDINSKDKEGKTLLVYAIEEEDKFIVNYLLENHASIQLINQNIKYLRKLTKNKKENKKELLENFEFRMKNKFNIIKILLEYGLDIEAKDEEGKTLLFYAIEDENELIVNYLLENHASIQPINENIKYLKELTKNNKENEKELLKTFEFRMKNKLNIIKLLLKYGLDINAEDEERKTLLLYVIDEVNESLFYYLLKNKTSHESLQAINIKVLLKFIFNTIENENENVLNKLSKYANREKEEEKCIEILKLLIQNGLDINDKDEEGNTILIYAIELRKVSVIKYLLERNASLEPVNSKVEILKPLITNIIPKSCLSGEICYIDNLNFNILKLLIDYGLNMENNKKLLHYAIQNSNTRIVNYFFDYGLTININSNFGKILLNHQKMKNSNPEINQLIENLLNNKKFISIINRNIKLIRSLFNSIQKRTILLKLLIQNGLDVNAIDEDKHSLLY